MLKFPPLIPHRFTERVVVKKKGKNPQDTVFRMYDRKGNCLGKLEIRPEAVENKLHFYSPNSEKYNSLRIRKLISHKKRQGVGTSLINVAKIESFKKFCNGNIHVIASDVYDEKHPPQVFYKKVGFKFGKYEKETEKIVDDYIKGNKPISRTLGDSFMYIEKNVDNSGKYVKCLQEARKMFPDIFHWI